MSPDKTEEQAAAPIEMTGKFLKQYAPLKRKIRIRNVPLASLTDDEVVIDRRIGVAVYRKPRAAKKTLRLALAGARCAQAIVRHGVASVGMMAAVSPVMRTRKSNQ